MIIGRDLFRSLVIDIQGADTIIHWDYDAIPRRDIYSTTNNVFVLSQHNTPFNYETKRMKRILNVKYSKADIKKPPQKGPLILIFKKEMSYTLLNKYECLFHGNICTWHGKPYDIKLKPDAEPYHGKPLPVPRIHELTFKQELYQDSYLFSSVYSSFLY